MIDKTRPMGEIVEQFPEVIPVFSEAGLHCIGCHVSEYESLEQGCVAHGMSQEEMDELLQAANKKVKEYDSMTPMSFTDKAVTELEKRLAKSKMKFIRLVQNFSEFDFEPADAKNADDLVIEAHLGGRAISILASGKIERLLRGIRIDFDTKANDFSAEKVIS